MADVRIDGPETMNVLGLFLARGLRANLLDRGRTCRLRGAMTVEADGMRASIRFEDDAAVVTSAEVDARVVVRASLARFVAALAHPGLASLLRIRWTGNPIFALRALRYLTP
jgi:hypothetical protein